MLNTSLSSYWLLLCIVLGVGYAYIQYTAQKQPWSRQWKWLLFVLRAATVAFTAFLFLEPYIQKNLIQKEPKELIILWDDSESIKLVNKYNQFEESRQQIRDLTNKLKTEKALNVSWRELSDPLVEVDSLNSTAKITPIQQALDKIAETEEVESITELILVSDGIYNRGSSPDYYAYPFKITTVGLGDTLEKRDIAINTLRFNKVAYQGNVTPIDVELTQAGVGSENIQITLKQAGEVVDVKKVSFLQNELTKTVRFLVSLEEAGVQKYTVELDLENEDYNPSNNSKNAFITVVEGKKKILLLAAAPHPDIKAINKAIEQNQNYELTIAINGISDYKEDNYDLAILFHLPNNSNTYQSQIQALKNKGTPLWFIVASGGANISKFNLLSEAVKLNRWNEIDEANIYLNNDFTGFKIDEAAAGMEELPPAYMPFAEHQINPLSQALFYKSVGSVKTQQPISIFFEEESYRESVLMLEGFWNWRLLEFLRNNDTSFFDAWIGNTVRWLTTLRDKNQLKVNPEREIFLEFEPVKLSVETYNQVYERIYGAKIDLLLQSEDSLYQYSFVNERLDENFEIGNLKEGSYNYTAKTIINGKEFSDNGQFVVNSNNIEELNLVANYDLLKSLSTKNQGHFFTYAQFDSLKSYLMSKDYPQTLKNDVETVPIGEDYWIYILILALVFSEWFLRRYYGSY